MRWSLVVAYLLASGAIAGCAEPSDGPKENAELDGDQGPPVEVEPGLVIAAKQGAVRGTVHSDTGLVVPGAFVQLVGTGFAADSNDTGQFLFINVSVGEHRLRVEATGYRAHESTLQVTAGEVTEIHPTLIPAELGNADYRSHVHDYWGSETQIDIVDRTYDYDEFRVHSTTADAYPELNEASSRVLYANTIYSGLRYRIPMPDDQDRPPLVYGGANRVEVKLTWNNAPPAVPVYALGYSTAADDEVILLAKHGPGDPWSIEVTPTNADNGHQMFSLWNFYIIPTNNAASAPDYRPALGLEPIAVKITVFKGDAPQPEPAHPEFWINGSRILLRDPTSATYTSTANVWAPGRLRLAGLGLIVPPGTKWIEVDLVWAYTDAVPSNVVEPNYVLYYNPGNEHYDRFTKEYKLAPAATKLGAGHLLFNITVEPGETDGYYQAFTSWWGALRIAGSPTGQDGMPPDFYRGRTYKYTITAIKDPALDVR